MTRVSPLFHLQSKTLVLWHVMAPDCSFFFLVNTNSTCSMFIMYFCSSILALCMHSLILLALLFIFYNITKSCPLVQYNSVALPFTRRTAQALLLPDSPQETAHVPSVAHTLLALLCPTRPRPLPECIAAVENHHAGWYSRRLLLRWATVFVVFLLLFPVRWPTTDEQSVFSTFFGALLFS